MIRVKENWIAYYTMLSKESIRILRIWPQTLLPPVISITLYFVIFGNLIGSKIGKMQGVSYIEYIIPGLIMMPIIQNSYANVVSSFFGAKFQKHIEELLVSPISNSIILWGFISGGIIRGILVGLLVTIVSLFFAELKIVNISIVISVVILTSILFSLAGLLNGIFAKKFDDISIIPTFVLLPLIYLGGIFYSIDLLPKFWQGVTHINPIFYIVNAFRSGILGYSDVSITYSLSVIVLFTIIFYILCLWLLHKGVGVRS